MLLRIISNHLYHFSKWCTCCCSRLFMTNSHVCAYWTELFKQLLTSAFVASIFFLFEQFVVISLTFYIHLHSILQCHNCSIFSSWYCYCFLSFENILTLCLVLSIFKLHQDSLIVDHSLYNVQRCVVSFALNILQLWLILYYYISSIFSCIFNYWSELLW